MNRARIKWNLALPMALLLSGCAVGPDFRQPVPPSVGRITASPPAQETASADTPGGAAQKLVVSGAV